MADSVTETPVVTEKEVATSPEKKAKVAETTAAKNGSESEKGAENGSGDASVLFGKIAKQLEYYFGDFNLGRDKFLKQQIANDPEGWVKIETLLTFNRLKALTTEANVVAEVAKTADAKLIQVHEDGDKIRRNPKNPAPELDDQRKEELAARTTYMKRFPPNTTLDELQEFLKDHEVETIQFRKSFSKVFKGSIFVVHKTKEAAEKLMKLESLVYGETTLTRETKEEYHKRKTIEKARYAEEKEKKKKEKQAKKDAEEKEEKAEEAVQEKTETEAEEKEPTFVKGMVLKMTGLGSDTTFRDIRDFLKDITKVAWLDFTTGDSDAWVRFDEMEAQKVMDKLKEKDDKVELKGSQIELAVVEGEAEVEYWKEVAKAREAGRKRKRDNDHGGRGKRGRFRGGYRGK